LLQGTNLVFTSVVEPVEAAKADSYLGVSAEPDEALPIAAAAAPAIRRRGWFDLVGPECSDSHDQSLMRKPVRGKSE
jgi:hypothetical protein